ncbi:MAG TPA: class I SAM-dependent methyltransferase [Bacteroidia bacterium]|nr:class I SAM-dependent methyltransferase [Bacteroidia bacterium]
MKNYLDYTFVDSDEVVNTFDELPLWSASFGLLMLKHLNVYPNLTVVDIGSGTGFPLFELAARFGKSCKFYGVDNWENANKRANEKMRNYELENVEIISTSAATMPFENNSVDLIVSNLGINNFEQPHLVFAECCRVLKPKGKLVLTTNVNGHWKKFYVLFENTLSELDHPELITSLQEDQKHRGTIESVAALFTQNGFKTTQIIEDNFVMKFQDGTAFLNHHFVKLGWISSWLDMIPKQIRKEVFSKLEFNLNSFASKNKGLNLSVPMLFMEGEKL